MEKMCNRVKEIIKELSKTKGTNAKDLYKSHLYWSQKPYNICDLLIKKLSANEDTICDPFLGSGVTLIETLLKGSKRRAIGIEINDYPLFLIRTLLEKYQLIDVLNEFTAIKNTILSMENELYSTQCPYCGQKHDIIKTLFNYDEKRNITLEKIYFKCSGTIVEKVPATQDLEKFNNIDLNNLRLLKNQKLLENSRIAVKANSYIFDIFTKRNLFALDNILTLIQNSKYKNLLLYSLLGVIHLSKITDFKSSSQWPLWTPNKNCIEKNVYDLFLKSLDKTIASLADVEKSISSNRREVHSYDELIPESYLILQKGTQKITQNDIPDESVDLIITDPPYLGQVIYSEYMQLYQPFLNNTIDYETEIVVSKTKQRNKSEMLYYQELELAFKQISRILKTGKVLALYFHDANLNFWSKLYNITDKYDLGFVGQTHIDKSKNTIKNILSPKKSLSGDALLFFIKGYRDKLSSTFSIEFAIENIKKIAQRIINENGGKATTAQLYDNGILEYILKSGSIHELSKKYSDLTDIFSTFLVWENGVWKIN